MTELAASFAELALSQGTLDILAQRNYTTPTPIQAMVIPRLLSDAGDLIAQAQTGTGKTAAYALPIIEKLLLDEKYSPDGYNIGINCGEAAGQTIFHVHVHLIPRYAGDVEHPRGGVRGVIPAKRNYP